MGRNNLYAKSRTDSSSNWPLELEARLQRGPIALFVGSGISIDPPSLLPDGNTLKKDLFSAIIANTNVPDNLLESVEKIISDYRPELFIDLVNEWGGTDWKHLLDFMLGTKPNMNHSCIVHLSKLGKLNMVVTTNFDCLIEDALKAEGLQFKTFCISDEFDSWQDTDGICLAKLHGSLLNSKGMLALDSLRGTLREVGYLLPEGKANLLKHVLTNYTVIFLGYSGHDEFDILPILLGIKQPDIIWVTHSEDHILPRFESSKEIRAREERDHIDKIVAESDNCYRVTYQTWSFLAQLCKLITGSAPDGPMEYLLLERRMPKPLNQKKHPLSLLGLFLWHGRHWNDAIEALELAFQEDSSTKIPFYRSELQRGIGISQKELGHLEQAKQALFRARDLCEEEYDLLRQASDTKLHQNYFRMMSQISEDIGLTLISSKDHDNAINWIKDALGWTARLVFPRQAHFTARNLGSLGIAYKDKAIKLQSLDDFNESSILLEAAIKGEEETGNIYGQVIYLYHTSQLYFYLSMWDRALDSGCRCISLMQLLRPRFPKDFLRTTTFYILVALCGLAQNYTDAEAFLGNYTNLGNEFKNELLSLYRDATDNNIIFAGSDPQSDSIETLFNSVRNSLS